MKAYLLLLSLLASPLFARNALYEVPVPADRTDLTEAAEMQATSVQFSRKGTEVSLRYKLPRELTGGASKRIELSNPHVADKDRFHLDGDGVIARCAQEETRLFTCKVDYVMEDLGIDPERLAPYLSQVKQDPEEFQKALEVSRIFESEARGFVKGLRLREKKD